METKDAIDEQIAEIVEQDGDGLGWADTLMVESISRIIRSMSRPL